MKDFLKEFTKKELKADQNEEDLLSRKEVAKFLRVSLPTLTDWIKRGYLLIDEEAVFILIKLK